MGSFATPNRSGSEFAQVIFKLAMQYPEARTIHLVLDNKYSPPQIADGSSRRRGRRGGLGPIHRAPYAHPRELAESGRDRNRPVLTAMPRHTANPGPGDPRPQSPRMEPRYEPPPDQNQLEV